MSFTAFQPDDILTNPPLLMGLEASTVYLANVVASLWTDATGTVPVHNDLGAGVFYTYDTNIPGQEGITPNYDIASGGGLRDPSLTNTALQLIGDLTMEMVASIEYDGASNGVVMAASGETEAANAIYTLRILTSDGESFETFTESGAGVNRSVSGDWKTPVPATASGWHHWAIVYQADGQQTLYVDGRTIADEPGLAPTGGADTFLSIGSFGDGPDTHWRGVIRDVRISSVSKSQPEIYQAARLALGI